SHVQIKIGESTFMMRDPSTPDMVDYVAKGFARTSQELGGTPVSLYVYVDDVDGAFNRALASGSKIVDPLEDKEWGDRCGGVQDPFGFIWFIATPLANVRRPASTGEATAEAPSAPTGYHNATPYLLVEEAPKLMDFLKQAFGAAEVMRAGD